MWVILLTTIINGEKLSEVHVNTEINLSFCYSMKQSEASLKICYCRKFYNPSTYTYCELSESKSVILWLFSSGVVVVLSWTFGRSN